MKPFKIVRGGLEQSNTSIAIEADASRVNNDLSNTSMVGENTHLDKDDWFEKVCFQLAKIQNLREGWDGYDADGLAKPTINFAAMLLASVWPEANPLPDPAITAMSNGAIMIEWRSQTYELTLEVKMPNDVDVVVEEVGNGDTEEFHASSDFRKISDALEQCARVRAVA